MVSTWGQLDSSQGYKKSKKSSQSISNNIPVTKHRMSWCKLENLHTRQ